MKISFDFDQTLSEKIIQDICTCMIKSGHEVVILTSRLSEEFRLKHYNSTNHHNEDLYNVANRLGIQEVIFTNGQFKSKFVLKHNIDLHYDDMEDEVDRILHSGGNALLFNMKKEYLKYLFEKTDYSDHKLNNCVYKAESLEDCLKIQNLFENNNIDIEEFDFIYSSENNDEFIYYGIVNGYFDNHSKDYLKNKNVIYGII